MRSSLVVLRIGDNPAVVGSRRHSSLEEACRIYRLGSRRRQVYEGDGRQGAARGVTSQVHR